MDDAEVGDDSGLVLLVAELAKDDERLLEMLHGLRRRAALGESESKVVEGQCLGLLIAEIADDRQRDTVLFGSLLVLASTSKLRSELVEPKRLTAAAKWTQSAGVA